MKHKNTLYQKIKKMGLYDNKYTEKPIFINGVKTQYKIRSNGEVISTECNGKIRNEPLPMSGGIDKDGYHIISLSLNGKRYMRKVHRLVAEAFIENPYNKPEVNHIDGNKLNNNIWNLEWVTSCENTHRAMDIGLRQTSLNESIVIQICKLLECNLYNISEISLITGVNKYIISKIKNGLIWKHVSKDYKLNNYNTYDHVNNSGKRLSENDIINICIDLEKGDKSMSKIAQKHNTTISTIRRIYQRENHSDISNNYDFSNYRFKINQFK